MKKNDWTLLISVAAYSYLFYKQSLGINFLVFNGLIISLLMIRNIAVTGNYKWWLAAAGSMVSAACIMIYGNALSFIANVISLSLLAGLSMNWRTSVVTTLLFSLYSYLSSIVFMVLDWVERRGGDNDKPGASRTLKNVLLMVIFPLTIALIFFFMYRASNPVFNELTKDINFDFITWSWVRFTLAGLLLMYGLFYHRKLGWIASKDELSAEDLDPVNYSGKPTFKFLSLSMENATGLILLTLLNLLLLSVNVIDVIYLYLNASLPEDMTYSEFVHQGTGMLITSIISAILIILFYFKGELNFRKKSNLLRWLAFLWIAQNAFMIISTAFRNDLYIDEYSLTYKRIGVYVYLLLAIIGLVFTFYKIYRKKSNWFLVRKTGWTFYFVLILGCLFNWDMIITGFNTTQAATKSAKLDTAYLVGLASPANIPDLLDLAHEMSVKEGGPDPTFEQQLHSKMYDFLHRQLEAGWQSWGHDKSSSAAAIMRIENEGKIKHLDLTNKYISTLKPVQGFSHLQQLRLHNNLLADLSEFAYFPDLISLDLAYNQLDTLDAFPALEKLERLDLGINRVFDLSSLERMPQLTYLDLSSNDLVSISSIPKLEELRELNLSGNRIHDYSYLDGMKRLEILHINNIQHNYAADSLPEIPSLIQFSYSGNGLGTSDIGVLGQLAQLRNIKSLVISGNAVSSLLALTNRYKLARNYEHYRKFDPAHFHDIRPLFDSLERLDISSNQITYLAGVELYEKLVYLNVANNRIEDISALSGLVSLSDLDLSGNKIRDMAPLKDLVNLTALNISGNSVNQLGVVKPLAGLTRLSATNNKINDLVPLSGLTALTSLSLDNNLINDIHALGKLKNLEFLNLRGNTITDYSPLYSLKNLKYLYIDYLEASELQQLKKALPDTEINGDWNWDSDLDEGIRSIE